MPEKPYPPRRKRSESFLGIHFDFHAGDDNAEIGKYTTREMIETIVQKVKPDYIQTDCKGHAGYSSYPTRVGYPAPGIVADSLRIWRAVTAENGVGLYMHYSGVWDNQAVLHHPEWARIDETGQPDMRLTSTFGAYVDELLIPQLKELCDDYAVDGVWVDGECWAVRNEYAPAVIQAWQNETGFTSIPIKPGDQGYFELSQYCREAFRKYLRHYIDVLHAHNPDFQITSNWAFSSMMPEPVSAEVDYISGDFTLQDSLNNARLEARCLARQGKPWDLMSWAFAHKIDWVNQANSDQAPCIKGAVQLMQEAAIPLALGGGYQAYFTQKRNGAVRTWQMDIMAEVAKFCRARQPFCHKQELIPQVGLIYPQAAIYRQSPSLFQPGDLRLPTQGVLQMLLDCQQVVEIVSEHHLYSGAHLYPGTHPAGRMAEYPLLVLPEWGYLDPAFRQDLVNYVQSGGNLLLIGPQAIALFEDELGVRFNGELQPEATWWLEHAGLLAGLSRNPFRPAELMPGTVPFGKLFTDNDLTGSTEHAACIRSLGKGKIAGVFVNLGERYAHSANYVVRRFMEALVQQLFPNPLVQVSGGHLYSGAHLVDVCLGKKDGKILVNLINTSGPHGDPDVYTYDEIVSLGPLNISLRLPTRPSQVSLQPAGMDLPFAYQDGIAQVTIPRLDIYEILVIDF